MEIFSHKSYRAFLKAWMQSQANGGRGIPGKIARQLKVSTVLVSQILGGSRALRPDHAFGLTEFLGLSPVESEYFLLLVQIENAGSESYRTFLRRRLEALRGEAAEIKSRVARDIRLSEAARARFYSHWHYSAVRLLTDIPGRQSPEAISAFLGIDRARVKEILDFLVEEGLCRSEGGKFQLAVRSTHLESDSPWIYSRQLQWRQKAMQAMERPGKKALFYTGPMVLSVADQEWVRERLVELVAEVAERARNSPSEEIACLNIDWFPVGAH